LQRPRFHRGRACRPGQRVRSQQVIRARWPVDRPGMTDLSRQRNVTVNRTSPIGVERRAIRRRTPHCRMLPASCESDFLVTHGCGRGEPAVHGGVVQVRVDFDGPSPPAACAAPSTGLAQRHHRGVRRTVWVVPNATVCDWAGTMSGRSHDHQRAILVTATGQLRGRLRAVSVTADTHLLTNFECLRENHLTIR
jgi:hypothetical protein